MYSHIDKNSKQFFDLRRQTFFIFRTAVSNTRSLRSVRIAAMVVGGTCSCVFLFGAVLIFFPRDVTVLKTLENGQSESPQSHEAGETYQGNWYEDMTESYPFDKAYYSYKVQSTELVKDMMLKPPIAYKTPLGYSLVLEPITHFCKVINTSIITKFSILNSKDEVYINTDDDLTNILTSDSTIVYKLKAISDLDPRIIGGETTVLIRIVQYLPAPDTSLEFEEPFYTLKLSFGRKGKVFKFKALKTAIKAKEKDEDLEFEKQPRSYEHFEKEEYIFRGNYSLDNFPDNFWSKVRIGRDGDLELIGVIDEGFYNFEVVAVDFGPNSSTVLTARAKVNMFVDSIAVCNSKVSNFIKAFSKHYVTEGTKLQTAVPATGSSRNCSFSISHQYPLGAQDRFFAIDPKTGAVNVIRPIDREAYSFENMDEPSVYMRLKIHCPPLAETPEVLPFHLPDRDNIVYDPTSTLVQLVIIDTNDNKPVFPYRRLTIGYPVTSLVISCSIVPRYVVQVKAVDKDVGKHGKIVYSLVGRDEKDFAINSETGMVYATELVNDENAIRTFDVLAKDSDGKHEGSESVLTVIVKSLSYPDIVRVIFRFSSVEDLDSTIESQLSEITGYAVFSLTNDVISTYVDGQFLIVKSLTVYGVNTLDDSLVSASDLEKKLSGNANILSVSRIYPEKTQSDGETNTVLTIVYATLFCLVLSIFALGLLYFGFVKNGRYLSCIPSTSNTPLKDDMENISQSNWITTFNRSNLSSNRVRLPWKVHAHPAASRSKTTGDDATTTVTMENGAYAAIPPKGKVSADNPLAVELDSKPLFEDHHLLKAEKLQQDPFWSACDKPSND